MVDLLVDKKSDEFIDMMAENKAMASRFAKLPEGLREQIREVYEKDKNAVICGSTALFLYGAINRIPQDLDVISSKYEDLRGTIKESTGGSAPSHDGEDIFYQADQELYDEIADQIGRASGRERV